MAMPPPFPQPDREVLAGIVERVTFHNADNGFCVLRVKARPGMETSRPWSATRPPPANGSPNYRTHGRQFKARVLRASTQSFPEGIERYLASCIEEPFRDGRSNRRQ
jgi:exodeoxyribonuclease V alpha subunit